MTMWKIGFYTASQNNLLGQYQMDEIFKIHNCRNSDDINDV